MNQPYQGQPQQGPPPGYGYQQQPQYQQQPPPGYQQQPQQGPPPGYGAPQGYGQAQQTYQGYQGSAGYDFRSLYGEADHSAGQLYEAQIYDAVVEESVFGRTRNKDKDQWGVKVRIYGPQGPRGVLSGQVTISPNKNTGERNLKGMGMMFHELHALGAPVGPPTGPPGEVPWWDLGWTPEQVAQNMVGRPCQVDVIISEWPEGSGNRNNKINRFLPARQGFVPGQVGQPVQGQAPGPYNGPAQGPAQPPPAAPQQPQYAAAPQQPPAGPPGQAPGSPPWQPGGPAQPPGQPQYQPQQYQQQPQQGPPPGYQPQQGLPPHAQPGMPGQGGTGQFTPQGQAFQPGTVDQHTQQAQQAMANGQPGWQAQPGQPPPVPPQPGQQQQQQQQQGPGPSPWSA